MAEFEAARTVKQKPTNNIYSGMVFIAFVALAIGVGVMWYFNVQMTGPQGESASIRPTQESFPNPFYIVKDTDLQK